MQDAANCLVPALNTAITLTFIAAGPLASTPYYPATNTPTQAMRPKAPCNSPTSMADTHAMWTLLNSGLTVGLFVSHARFDACRPSGLAELTSTASLQSKPRATLAYCNSHLAFQLMSKQNICCVAAGQQGLVTARQLGHRAAGSRTLGCRAASTTTTRQCVVSWGDGARTKNEMSYQPGTNSLVLSRGTSE